MFLVSVLLSFIFNYTVSVIIAQSFSAVSVASDISSSGYSVLENLLTQTFGPYIMFCVKWLIKWIINRPHCGSCKKCVNGWQKFSKHFKVPEEETEGLAEIDMVKKYSLLLSFVAISFFYGLYLPSIFFVTAFCIGS